MNGKRLGDPYRSVGGGASAVWRGERARSCCRGTNAGNRQRPGGHDPGGGGAAGRHGATSTARCRRALHAEGLAGLHDRPRLGPRSRLSNDQHEQLRQLVLDGPDVEATGLSAWTLGELCREVATRWGVRYHEGHMSKLMRKLGLSWAKGAPVAPQGGPGGTGSLRKRGLQSELGRVAAAHPGQGRRVRVATRMVSRRGHIRSEGPCVPRLVYARPAADWSVRSTLHLFAAVQPATGASFALVLPELSDRSHADVSGHVRGHADAG